MVAIENYLNDGADWRSQVVLSYLKGFCSDLLDKNMSHFSIKVARLENGSEQGYVVTATRYLEQLHFWVCTKKDTEDIVVRKLGCSDEGFLANAPTLYNVYECGNYSFFENNHKDDFKGAAKYIITEIENKFLKK